MLSRQIQNTCFVRGINICVRNKHSSFGYSRFVQLTCRVWCWRINGELSLRDFWPDANFREWERTAGTAWSAHCAAWRCAREATEARAFDNVTRSVEYIRFNGTLHTFRFSSFSGASSYFVLNTERVSKINLEFCRSANWWSALLHCASSNNEF